MNKDNVRIIERYYSKLIFACNRSKAHWQANKIGAIVGLPVLRDSIYCRLCKLASIIQIGEEEKHGSCSYCPMSWVKDCCDNGESSWVKTRICGHGPGFELHKKLEVCNEMIKSIEKAKQFIIAWGV